VAALESAGTYRFGDAFLTIQSEHRPFWDRFHHLFAGCQERPSPSALIVRCTVTCPPPGRDARIALDPERTWDRVTAATTLFGDRGWYQSASSRGRLLHEVTGTVTLEEIDGALVARNDERWEWIVGNLALHRVLMLQPDLAVFHAASVVIDGRGVMILGPKGAGKTTLSLALAARGHAFLGDETAAVRLPSRELVPFRRAVSLRSGPASRHVTSVLAQGRQTPECFPDGTSRTRLPIEQLFPHNIGRPAPLTAVVFLTDIAAAPQLDAVVPSRHYLSRLGVLRSTMWDAPPALRVVRLAGMLLATRSFILQPGDPDATAEALEREMLRSCH
jgi:hypothetical protein